MDCTLDAMNAKLDTILPAIPLGVLRAGPVCPIPGVFPPVPFRSDIDARPRRIKRRRAAATPEEPEDTLPPRFIGPVRPKSKRFRKSNNGEVNPALVLPVAFSAHSPIPLIAFLTNVPKFTLSGQSESWQTCKSTKFRPSEGREHDFDLLSAMILQRLTAWGITGDMKKVDDSWSHFCKILVLAGVSRPSVPSVGPMLRWWVAGYSKLLLTV